MAGATIKLFLVQGDANRLRTAELSNWSGKAVAAPRTEFDHLLKREELQSAGVYILVGRDPDTGKPAAYIGEAELLAARLPQHRSKDYWNSVVVFTSKDDNLTKAHVKFLEGELLTSAQEAGRVVLLNGQGSGARLPESDREDMQVFLQKVHQLLPVLGADILTPIEQPTDSESTEEVIFTCETKGLVARGRRTPTGFVVLQGSQAVAQERPSAAKRHPFVPKARVELLADGTLVKEGDHFRFTKSTEFSSPSLAAGVVQGGGVSGLTAWRDEQGRTLKAVEESA